MRTINPLTHGPIFSASISEVVSGNSSRRAGPSARALNRVATLTPAVRFDLVFLARRVGG